MFSLRAGNKSTINGNFMLQGGQGGAGGIKIYEKDHKVYNNYIDNASEYPILIGAGDCYNCGHFSHAQVFRAQVVHNTVVNLNNRPVIIGHGSTDLLPPTGCVFANNIIKGTATLLSLRVPGNTLFSHNIASGTLGATKAQSEFWVVDPLFTTSNGLQKLSSSSPAIGYANTTYYPYVTDDMDGQARSAPDTGADELSASPIVLRPLTTADVGPNAP
jgi:hypothetical protein